MFTTSPIGSKHRVPSQPLSRPVELPSQFINLQPGYKNSRESKVDPEKQRQTVFGLTNRYQPMEMDSEMSSANGAGDEESEDVMFSAEESARLNDEFHQLSFQQMDDTMAEDDSVILQQVVPAEKPAGKPSKHITFREQDSSILDHGSSHMSDDSSFAEGLRITSTHWVKKSIFYFYHSFGSKKVLARILLLLIPLIAYGLSDNNLHIPSAIKIFGATNYSEEKELKTAHEEHLRTLFEESERILRKEAEERIQALSIELSQKTEELNHDIASLAELLEQQKVLRKGLEEEVAYLRRQEQSYKVLADRPITEGPGTATSIEVDLSSPIINYASSSTVDKSMTSQCFLGSTNSAWSKLRRWLFVRYVDCTPPEQAIDDTPVDTGKFWSFSGNHGILTLNLPLVLSLDSFTVSVPRYMRLESPDISPNKISVWASVNAKLKEQLESIQEQSKKQRSMIPDDFVKILDFTYDLESSTVTQIGYFPEIITSIPVKKVMIEFSDNFGSKELTAVCKVGIFGQPFGSNEVGSSMLYNRTDDLYDSEDLLGHDEEI